LVWMQLTYITITTLLWRIDPSDASISTHNIFDFMRDK
jgi:hypothetical protein